jgi:hypothetical protein
MSVNCINYNIQNNNINDIVIYKKNMVISKKKQMYRLLEEINNLSDEINDIKNDLDKICNHKWRKDIDNVDFSTKYVCEYCDC